MLRTAAIIGYPGGTVNYNGATVRAIGNPFSQYSLQTSYVRGGGAIFDTNGLSYSVSNLKHDAALGATPDGGLTKLGAGTLVLDGTNTYTGDTTISAGVLELVPYSVSLTTSRVRFNGGTLRYGQIDTIVPVPETFLPKFSSADGQAIRVDVVSGTVPYSSDIGGGGGSSLTKLGTGTFDLRGTNTYTGTTTVSAGTLNAATPAALPGYATPGRVSVAGGAVLGVSLDGWSSGDIRALLDAGPFAGNGGLGLNAPAAAYGVGDDLAGTFRLYKLGTGALTLSGSNTFTGGVTVRAGTLALTNATLGTGVVGGVVSLSSNATLALGGSSKLTLPYSSAFFLDGGAITLADSAALCGSQEAHVGDSGTGSVIQNNGTGTLTVNGGTFTAGASAAITVAGQAGSTGTVRLNGGAARFYGLRGGAGTSTVYLNGTTLSGIDGTTVLLQNLTKAYVSTGGLPVNIGDTFATISQGLSHDPALGTTPDGGLTKLGVGTLTLTGTNTYTGPTTLAGGTVVVASSDTGLGSGGTIFSAAARSRSAALPRPTIPTALPRPAISRSRSTRGAWSANSSATLPAGTPA